MSAGGTKHNTPRDKARDECARNPQAPYDTCTYYDSSMRRGPWAFLRVNGVVALAEQVEVTPIGFYRGVYVAAAIRRLIYQTQLERIRIKGT